MKTRTSKGYRVMQRSHKKKGTFNSPKTGEMKKKWEGKVKRERKELQKRRSPFGVVRSRLVRFINVVSNVCFYLSHLRNTAHQKYCSSEIPLIRNTAHQKYCSSEILLIRNTAHQKYCSSEILLIRNTAHQKYCSSEILLIRNTAHQKY